MRCAPASSGISTFLALFACMSLSACQTTGGGPAMTVGNEAVAEKPVSMAFYTPFYDQGDHLAKLVDAGEFDDASKLFSEQRDFFNQKRDQHRQVLATLASHFSATAEGRLRMAERALKDVRWSVPLEDWMDIRAALALAKTAIDTYPKEAILEDAEFRSFRLSAVEQARSKLVAEIKEDAADQFRGYDHFGETGFFEVYPVNVKSPGFLRDNFNALEAGLDGVGADKLTAFSRHFTKKDVGLAAWNRLGNRYLKALLAEGGGTAKPDLKTALEAVSKARDAGFEPNGIPGLEIAFVEITSRTLLKQGQIEFPVAVDVDLPVETVRAELDKALIDHTAQFSDYTIILDVALAKTKRRVTGTKKMPARILAGYRTEPNPEYRVVENEVAEARMTVQNAALDSASVNSQYCQGIGCFGKAIAQLAAGAARGKAQEGLKASMERLRATPMTLEIPVYRKYRYDKATVKSSKLMTVHYYVVDRKKREFFKSTFDIEEERTFGVAYGVHEDDPEKSSHMASADSEDDVIAWEEEGAGVALSRLVQHYIDNAGESRPLPRLTDLREEMLRDKNQALARYREQTFEGSTQSDPRFDSVVVIYTLDGTLGTGFFVRPDVVMTNHHVVEDGEFVEMKMYGGQETFGKVIARDVRIDLALIKVQARGKPVKFYSDNKIELGSTVEVIGHPRGLEFSITRGVISAVREMQAPNIRTKRGVLHLQIDAATNRGNSGGPVFMEDKVVGVVSWGLPKSKVENLNFTIHYSEAIRFFKEELGVSS